MIHLSTRSAPNQNQSYKMYILLIYNQQNFTPTTISRVSYLNQSIRNQRPMRDP